MTQKEKAKELVDNFYQLFPLEMYVTITEGDLSWEYNGWQQSKKCALIAVDEMIKELDELLEGDERSSAGVYYLWVYYNEVKQEIQKL